MTTAAPLAGEPARDGTTGVVDDGVAPGVASADEAAVSVRFLGPPPESPFVYADGEGIENARDSRRRRCLALADILAIVLAYAAVAFVLKPVAGPTDGHLMLAIALPPWIVLNKALRLYDRDDYLIHKSTLNEIPAILESIAFGSALVFLVSPLVGAVDLQRSQVLLFWLLALFLTVALRWATRAAVRSAWPPERILIVGSGHVAGLVSRKISAHPEYGACVLGYVDVTVRAGSASPATAGITQLGDVKDFEALCREHAVERVIIAFSSLDHEHLLDMIRISKRLRLKISVVPRLFEVIGHSVEIDQIEGMTVLGLRSLSRTRSTLMLKRTVDLLGAGTLLLLASPALLATAIAIKLTSRGPILFAQDRVGRGHRPFRMLKFRTMVENADDMKAELAHLNEMDGKMFKISDDPRVTKVGRVLRSTSIDELPQLLNVIRGEMSLVGPRPLVPDENDHTIGWHRARLDLTPGLTGPWQVMGRNAIPFDEMVKLDYLYVAEWSLWNDFKLLIRTLPVVLRRRGT